MIASGAGPTRWSIRSSRCRSSASSPNSSASSSASAARCSSSTAASSSSVTSTSSGACSRSTCTSTTASVPGTRSRCVPRCASMARRSRSSPAPASSPATCCSRTSASRGTTAWCYDYDEIQPITDVHFLRIPAARSYEEELSAEPYWRVGEHDVFPEQFDHFLVSEPRARELFYEYHRDLLDPAFWRAKQDIVRSGEQEDVFPYPEEIRFARTPRAARRAAASP